MGLKRLLIIGHGRHGKDTVAEMLNEKFGLEYRGSSEMAAEIFIFDALKDKFNYATAAECFDDRHNHRDEWYQMICGFNEEDRAKLAKEIMRTSDAYIGMRDDRECDKCGEDNVFDYIVGVFDPRKPLEPSTSFNIDMWSKCDFIIPNGGSLEDLDTKVEKVFTQIFK